MPGNGRFAQRRIVRRAGASAYYAGVIRVRMTIVVHGTHTLGDDRTDSCRLTVTG